MRYRCLVKGVPNPPEARIKVPLKKFSNGNDMELRPYIEGTKKNFVYYPETEYKVMNSDRKAYISLLGVTVEKGGL
jgi:hypothetical protein